MYLIFRDLRVTHGRLMAGGLQQPKLHDCHMYTTVTPTQVCTNILTAIICLK